MAVVTDPIADMLTRIRNGLQAGHKSVVVPASNLKMAVLERLSDEGFVGAVTRMEDDRQGTLVVELRYDEGGAPVADHMERVSKPGRRVYVGAGEIPKARSGYGTVILSTSQGVVTDRKARELGIGGEVLCSVW